LQFAKSYRINAREVSAAKLEGKYLRAAVHIEGQGTPLRVTYALEPGDARQHACDDLMFTTLEKALLEKTALELVMSKTCLRLS